MEPGRLMGVGRMALLTGIALITVATIGDVSALAWSGIALSGVSLAINTVGKIVRYRRIDVPTSHRVSIVGAWLLLVTGLFGLLVDYTYAQFHPAYEGYFWALVIGVVGFALIYQGTRSKFVDDAVKNR